MSAYKAVEQVVEIMLEPVNTTLLLLLVVRPILRPVRKRAWQKLRQVFKRAGQKLRQVWKHVGQKRWQVWKHAGQKRLQAIASRYEVSRRSQPSQLYPSRDDSQEPDEDTDLALTPDGGLRENSRESQEPVADADLSDLEAEGSRSNTNAGQQPGQVTEAPVDIQRHDSDAG